MSGPVTTQPGRSQFPRMLRGILLAVVGAAIVIVVARVTHGVALAALVGMAIPAAVQRKRARRATRALLWGGACIAVAITYSFVVARLYWAMPKGTLTAVIDSARKVQDTVTPPRMPEAVERALGGRERLEQGARLNRLWATSRVGFLWALVMGTTIGLALIGIVVGTVAWAGTLLVMLGVAAVRGPPAVADG